MQYEFNLNVEKAYRVTVASNKPMAEVVAGIMKAFKEDQLQLDDGDFIKAELWNEDGDQVAELDGWGIEWVREEA